MSNMSEWARKLTQKQYSWNYPYLKYFFLRIQVGSRGMNDIVGLPRPFVTWDRTLTSTQRPFWSHGGTEQCFEISPILTEWCHMSACMCSCMYSQTHMCTCICSKLTYVLKCVFICAPHLYVPSYLRLYVLPNSYVQWFVHLYLLQNSYVPSFVLLSLYVLQKILNSHTSTNTSMEAHTSAYTNLGEDSPTDKRTYMFGSIYERAYDHI